MVPIQEQLLSWFVAYLPVAAGALAVLIIGWLVALSLRSIVRGAIRRTSVGLTLAGWLQGKDEGKPEEVSNWAGSLTYYLVMFFVLVGFLQVIGLSFIAEPLQTFLQQIFEYAPRLLAAAGLLILTWFVATVLKMVITRALKAARIEERLGDSGAPEVKETPLVDTMAAVVYWLVFLFFFPGILSVLSLEGLLVPVQNMLTVALAFLPALLAAALIVLAGWIGARILQQVVSRLLKAVGVDRVSDRLAVSSSLADLGGILAYAFVMIVAIVAALNTLGLEAVAGPASHMLGMLLGALPAILGAGLILTIAYIVGKVVAGIFTGVLQAAGFDHILQRIGLSDAEFTKSQTSPSAIVGHVILVAIMLFAGIEAAGLLGFTLVADLIVQMTMILGQVAVGLLIFGIGLYLAGLAHRAILASGGPQAGLLAKLARAAIVILVAAMALSQIGLAREIVVIGFSVVLIALALIAVIACGLGGRELAAREMENWLNRIRSKD